MTAALRELDEKFKAGVAYRRIETAPWVAYAGMEEMLSAVRAIYFCAWEHFCSRLPGWSEQDITELHTQSSMIPKNVKLYIKQMPQGANEQYFWVQEQIGHCDLRPLFILEKKVNREAKKLERIAALEARLAAAEEAAALSHQRQLALAAGLIHAGALEKRLNNTDELNAKLLERLEASEATNIKLLERLSTLEKLFI